MASDSVIYEELHIEGASFSGARTGGDSQASSLISTEFDFDSSSTTQSSSTTSVLELFGIHLEDLETESTGEVVEALVSGGNSVLVSALEAETLSGSTSVGGEATTTTSFDVIGVGGNQATTESAASGSLSSVVDIGQDSSADSTHGDASLITEGSRISGSEFDQIIAGSNWVTSSDVAASLVGTAESAFGHADTATKINEILGSSTAELLVEGSSKLDSNADVSLSYISNSQHGNASSTADLLQLLGLEIDGATDNDYNAEIGGYLELDADTRAAIDELANSESGDALTASIINDAGGISLGDSATGAGFDAEANVDLSIEQSSRSKGGDASASNTITESVAIEADSQLLSNGYTAMKANQDILFNQSSQTIQGDSKTLSIGDTQVGIELGTLESGDQIQLVVNNFLGGESTATSVLATASTEEIQNYIAGLEAESINAGTTLSTQADTSLSFDGQSVSDKGDATSLGEVVHAYGIDAVSTTGNTVNVDASASTSLLQLAETIEGDAQAIGQLGEQEAIAVSTLLSSGDAKLIANALASLNGDAKSVEGTAESHSQLSALLGLNSNTVGIEGDAEILAAIGLNSTNEASSMTGDAIANTLAGTIEGISVDQLDTSGEITIDSDVDADLKLLAASIEGTADAELTIDEIATLNGVLESDSHADLALSSDMSVSLESSSFSGDSNASFHSNQQSAATGENNIGDAISSGSSLNLIGESNTNLALEATSVDGDAALNIAALDGENTFATSGLNSFDLFSASDQQTSIDVNGVVSATANTQEGTATADVTIDMVAADASNISSNQDGEINLNASNTVNIITNTSSDDLEDQADLRLDSAVSGYRGGIDDSIDIANSGEISLGSNQIVDLVSSAEAGQASIAAELESIGASLDDTGILSLDGTGDITGAGVLQAELISESLNGNVDLSGSFKGRGIQGGEVQSGGLDGSINGNSEVNVNLLGMTTSGDSSNISQSTSVGLDDSILSTGFGTDGIRGESQQLIDSLSSTEFGDANAIHGSKSIGILANDETSTVVTSNSDVVAIAQDNSYVTAMTSQGQASSQSSSETVGISGAEVILYGDGNLVVDSNSSATALSSSNE